MVPLDFSRKASPFAPHILIGRTGEETARAFLCSLGYRIRAVNVRVERDEIDIIAYDPEDNVLAFVEVKARDRLVSDFRPAVNAGWKKWKRLRRAIHRWVSQEQYEGGYRIDLIEVSGGLVLSHTKAIGSSWPGD